MDENNTPKKSVRFATKFLIFFLIIFGIIIFTGYFLINLSNQENNLNLSNTIENIPTLIPITLLPTSGEAAPMSSTRKKIKQEIVSIAILYLNYLQEQEVENLYLLLTIESKKLYSREDLKKTFGESDFKITSFNIKDSIAFSNQPSINSDSAVVVKNGDLEVVLPISLSLVAKKGEKKSVNSELHAKFQNNLWQFDYFGPPNF